MGKEKEINGLVVGRLTVIKRNDDPRSKYINKKGRTITKQHYDCKCECGKIVSIRKDSLIGTKKTYSCGCLQKEASRKTGISCRKPKGVVPFNYIIYNYRKRAEKKGRCFDLTEDEFRGLIEANCYYCGSPPSNRAFNAKKPDDEFIYNGIDRIDTRLGYTKENVVSCCGNCNYAKSDLTQEEFFNLIEKIYKNHVHKIRKT